MEIILILGVYDRVYTAHSPSLGCVNDADKFTVNVSNGNGLLTYPVALLTADEIVLSGGKYGTVNSTYYLYTNEYWWTLSPSYFEGNYASGLIVNSYGNMIGNIIGAQRSVRPTLVLKPGTKITSGDGSMNSPFVVS